jgi:hypothetical protein
MTGDPDPQSKKSGKSPRRHWRATEPFFDLRLSHLIQSFLAFALLTVAGVQAFIYFNQAGIMKGQLDEMRASSAQTARASRPYLMFEPIAMTFHPTPEQFGLPSVPTGQRQFLALFKFTNYGATPAIIYREATR